MRRSLSSLWLKSLQRLGKAQQSQQKKLLKSASAAAKRAARSAASQAKAAATQAKAAAKPARKAAAGPRPKAKTRPTASAKPLTARKAPATRPRTKPATPATPPGSWTRSLHLSQGRRMAYWLYLPQRVKALSQKPMPLVVMLHGCTQTAPEFAQGTRMNALAQRKGFAVLYPQQLVSIDANRCWQWYKNATQGGDGEAALVADMLNQVVSKHGLDASRVYLAGLSAGAALAQIIALRYPYRIAAVGMHSGPVFGCADNRLAAFSVMQHGASHGLAQAVQPFAQAPDFPGMPAMVIHGDADRVVRPANLSQVVKQFCLVNHLSDATHPPVAHNTPARPGGRSPRHAYETLDYSAGRKPVVSVCRIAGLDHAWSGGDGSLRFNASAGPDASALLWSFFAKHSRK